MSDSDSWDYYRGALRKVKDNYSKYVVVTAEHPVGTREAVAQELVDSLANVTTYNLFVWLHHLVAKDNDPDSMDEFVDYAHEGTGFPTWHRLLLLWIEREIQVEIKDYTFRLPFWDWSEPPQREVLFTRERLGENVNGYVKGVLFDDWKTYCWKDSKKPGYREICDPGTHSNQELRRCPVNSLGGDKICTAESEHWPNKSDVYNAISIQSYDEEPYDRFVMGTDKSFRNFMEGFEILENGCNGDIFCTSVEQGNDVRDVTKHLHNKVHIILGLGDLKSNIPFEEQGVMSCVAASPNDPIFINHHANIDCILEQWLQANKDATYPSSSNIREGHRSSDYLVPFIPLYTHNQMFKTADNFGYACLTSQRSVCTYQPRPYIPTNETASAISATTATTTSLMLVAISQTLYR